MAIYSSALVKKPLTVVESCFKPKLLPTVKLKAGPLLNAPLHIRPLTFITEALRLSGSPSVASTASP